MDISPRTKMQSHSNQGVTNPTGEKTMSSMHSLTTLILAVVFAVPAVWADSITWNVGGGAGGNWDTTTTNWTADGAGRNDGLYADGDAVLFDDTGAGGSIALTADRAPLSTTVSHTANTYTFTGSGITSGPLTKSGAGILALNNAANSFSSVTVSGGEMQWGDDGSLGSGALNVTGNATLRSTKTTSQPVMNSSGINVSNDVTLDLYMNYAGHAGSAMVAPIHGGTASNPITLNLRHDASGYGRMYMSPSDFVGSVYLRNRMMFQTLADSHFGNSANRLYVIGGLETYTSNLTLNRPVTIQGGYIGGPSSGPIIFDGPVTNTGSPSIIGGVRFNNPASSLGGLYPNGGTIEFGYLPAGGSSRADGGGSNGVTFRFLGDLVGNASFGISKNYDWVDGVANSRWLYLDVPSAAAAVTLTSAVSGYLDTRGGFRKDGDGTLTLANAANNNVGAFEVRGGRLNVTGTLNGVTTMTVQSGATLGGTGTITGDTVVQGTHAPGMSPGIQNVGNYTLDGGTLEIEIEGPTAGNGTGFHDQVNVTGTVTLSNDPVLSIISASGITLGDVLTIINNDSIDLVSGTFSGLDEGARITAFGEKFAISYVGGDGNDVTLSRIPEPTSLSLLVLAGLGVMRRRYRRR